MNKLFFLVMVALTNTFVLSVKLRCCRKLPQLIINGTNIFKEKEGSHTLLAFLEGNNKDSRIQIKGMDLLLHNYRNMDILDINFMAINRHNDSGFRHLRRRAKFDIYQEPTGGNIWEELHISTNDFIIFDHCGYMVGFITFPSNYLWNAKGRTCTTTLIRNTYLKSPCKNTGHVLYHIISSMDTIL